MKKKVFQALVGWKFIGFNNILGICFLILIICLQIHVAWLAWHVSVLRYFENTWLEVACLILTVVSLFILFLWLQPIKFSSNFGEQQHFSFQRREALKLGVASLLFLLIIPAIGKAVPLIKGQNLGYRRKKNRLKKIAKLKNGFYLNQTKTRKVLYYFINGTSPSLKPVELYKVPALIRQLKRLDISTILDKKESLTYNIPQWDFIFENEAYLYAVNKEYLTAIRLLLFSMEYALARGITKYYTIRTYEYELNSSLYQTNLKAGGLIRRIKHFLIGLYFRAEKELPPNQVAELKRLVDEKIIAISNSTFDHSTIKSYRQKEEFIKKWQASESIPWYRVHKLPWN